MQSRRRASLNSGPRPPERALTRSGPVRIVSDEYSATENMIAPETLEYLPTDGADYLRHTDFNRSPTHRNRLGCLVKMVGRCGPAQPRILEIGCGIGNISIPLASLGGTITAIEPHEPSLQIAASRNPFPNLTFKHQSLEETELGAFDIIILTEVLEHVPDHKAMMKHLARGMRPDARLIVTLPNGRSLTERLCRPSYALKRTAAGTALVRAIKKLLGARDITTANAATPHVHFFSLFEADRLFTECGFDVLIFQRYFRHWLLKETFFTKYSHSEDAARSDFVKSQHIRPEKCSLWAFLLKPSGGGPS